MSAEWPLKMLYRACAYVAIGDQRLSNPVTLLFLHANQSGLITNGYTQDVPMEITKCMRI